jgi:hypothetical protein
MEKFEENSLDEKVTDCSKIWKKAFTKKIQQSHSMNEPSGFLLVSKIFDNFTFCKCGKSQICRKECFV